MTPPLNQQSRKFENVILQIQDAILRGRLNPGDKLARERKLREVFEVSRSTLREALRTIENKGLITIRGGGGRYYKSNRY